MMPFYTKENNILYAEKNLVFQYKNYINRQEEKSHKKWIEKF